MWLRPLECTLRLVEGNLSSCMRTMKEANSSGKSIPTKVYLLELRSANESYSLRS